MKAQKIVYNFFLFLVMVIPCSVLSANFLDHDYIKFEGSTTLKSQLAQHIEQISTNHVGSKLLDKIHEKYTHAQTQCRGIIFKVAEPGDKTAFFVRRREGKAELVIEIADIINSDYPVTHEFEEPSIAAISSNSTEFWITLAHELIHLKHKLEEIGDGMDRRQIDLSQYSDIKIEDIPYQKTQDINIKEIFSGRYDFLYRQLPELSEPRINMTMLWSTLEERRTVIGPDRDNISEASIRAAAGISARYIYQSSGMRFLESKCTISNSLLSKIIYGDATGNSALYYCRQDDNTPSELTPMPILLGSGVSEIEIIEQIFPGQLTQSIVNKALALSRSGDSPAVSVVQNLSDGLLQGISQRKLPKPQAFVFDVEP
ncbi:MAG: hypothetical protein ACD_21C00267G0008 [uncultured bacterium]|nr:MAG: hypothetical protein ACD_21C00267G0008 [uncultured bacterium]